jgi:hypothetical protein
MSLIYSLSFLTAFRPWKTPSPTNAKILDALAKDGKRLIDRSHLLSKYLLTFLLLQQVPKRSMQMLEPPSNGTGKE